MELPQPDLKTIVKEARINSAPSLKILCINRISAELCNHKEIRDVLKSLKYLNISSSRLKTFVKKEWKTIMGMILDRLNSLCLPIALKEDVYSYSFSIAMEIMKWLDAHPNVELPEEFRWTANGRIDYTGTAIMIVGNGSRSLKERFELSCIYCLETAILLLWINLSLRGKNYFLNEVSHPIIYYWVMKMCAPREKSMLCNISLAFQLAFINAVEKGNTYTVQHLFYKLHISERQSFLDKIFKVVITRQKNILVRFADPNESDAWFFIFSHMNPQLQKKYFSDMRSFGIISQMFLCSNRQKHLVKVMNLAEPKMHLCHYRAIGFTLLYKYILGYKDCDYRKLFIQYWRQTIKPDRERMRKKRYLGMWIFSHLFRFRFRFLLRQNSLQNGVKLMLRHLKSTKLERYISFDRDHWKFLLFLIKEQIITWPYVKRSVMFFLKVVDIQSEQALALKNTMTIIERIRANKKLKTTEFEF